MVFGTIGLASYFGSCIIAGKNQKYNLERYKLYLVTVKIWLHMNNYLMLKSQ